MIGYLFSSIPDQKEMPTSWQLLNSPDLSPFSDSDGEVMEMTLRAFVLSVPWEGREDDDVEDVMAAYSRNKVKVSFTCRRHVLVLLPC